MGMVHVDIIFVIARYHFHERTIHEAVGEPEVLKLLSHDCGQPLGHEGRARAGLRDKAEL